LSGEKRPGAAPTKVVRAKQDAEKMGVDLQISKAEAEMGIKKG
jgi:hypothetical protein